MVASIREEHCPIEVTVKEYKRTRSQQQNARHWALLTAISQYMPARQDGVYHHPEVWHALFASMFLGVEAIELGEFTAVAYKSTRRLNTSEFADLDEQILAYMAQEFGFFWSEHDQAA